MRGQPAQHLTHSPFHALPCTSTDATRCRARHLAWRWRWRVAGCWALSWGAEASTAVWHAAAGGDLRAAPCALGLPCPALLRRHVEGGGGGAAHKPLNCMGTSYTTNYGDILEHIFHMIPSDQMILLTPGPTPMYRLAGWLAECLERALFLAQRVRTWWLLAGTHRLWYPRAALGGSAARATCPGHPHRARGCAWAMGGGRRAQVASLSLA